jgi:hypothetical protein
LRAKRCAIGTNGGPHAQWRSVKPPATINQPPAESSQRQREGQTPDEWQRHVRNQAKHHEQQPEHFFLHATAFTKTTRRSPLRARSFDPWPDSQ